MGQYFYGSSQLLKVRLSMARLLTIVNERKKIRNEYRRHLEAEYIQKRQREEAKQETAKIMSDREQGLKTPFINKEIKALMQKKIDSRNNQIKRSKSALYKKFHSAKEDETKSPAPLLDPTDIRMLAGNRYKMSQKEILRRHVSNHKELDLKQKRQVMGHIQAQRAMHAKEIFLKELASVGSQRRARSAE